MDIKKRQKKIVFSISLLFILTACDKFPSQWTIESNNKKHVSWEGSYENSKKLNLIYHGVKFYDRGDIFEWGFKVKVAYPQNISDDTLHAHAREMGKWRPPNEELCIPISKIVYGIYDKDDFLIDSMTIQGECVTYQDTLTFQGKKKIRNELISRYSYGKVNFQAGYLQK